ncbi:MAG: DegT/DnrJ/EryC1/StrS family aminotransferase [Acidimicrobiales bacterium]
MSSPADGPGVPFFELTLLHEDLRVDLDRIWHEITADNAFIGGGAVDRFEERFASFCDVGHCVGVANGTDALELILSGLGIGPGDEVIVPGNTFLATAEAVHNVGASPVFVDVDPDTLLVTAEEITAAVTARTAAAIPVHLYGQMAAMPEILAACDRAGIACIEDAAQAHGARWDGRPAGSWGVAAGFSFYPGKNLGAFGDGGAVVTNDAALASRIRSIANHGRSETDRSLHDLIGRNSRLDGLQAAVLDRKLDEVSTWNEARRRVHASYATLLPSNAIAVSVRSEAEAVHHLEVVRVPDRDAVRDALAMCGIGTSVHYPIPCHLQPALQRDGQSELPVVEQAARHIVSLPMFPHLTSEQIARVASELGRVVSP